MSVLPAQIVVCDRCGRRWIRHCDLAARVAPEVMNLRCPLESRGRRESRVPMTPAVVRKNAHGGPQVRRITRLSLRDGFNGLWRALPGDEFLLPPSLTDWRSIEGPVGLDDLHQLDTSHGCQDHTLLPSAASSSHTPRPARMLPEEVSTEAFKRRSSARRSIAHGIRPATTRASDAAASTATRTPRIVTTRTSLFMRRDDAKKTSISEKGKAVYFFHAIWTTQITLK